ncbi:putative monooxygenase YdhR [Chlorella vulgaris]
MPVLLQVDFPFAGPFGSEMAQAMKGLAESIAMQVWTENEAAQEAGGIYLFADRPSAEAYITMHKARLQDSGIAHINVKIFDVNEELSAIDRAPLQ